ncbi:hypothetical protein A7A51_06425 [Acinetobacter baumannii]|nr:hypothetical protein A7A51_06425 [Acinetobacter baumannii]
MAGCSLNQADIKFIFKVNNASAELGFTNIFGLTGRTKAAVFYDQIEIIKIIKRAYQCPFNPFKCKIRMLKHSNLGSRTYFWLVL